MREIDIINKIKQLRSEKRLTQAELADAVNIPYRSYQRLEAGESHLKIDTLIDILLYLQPDSVKAISQAIFEKGTNFAPGALHIVLPNKSRMMEKSFLGRSVFEIELFTKLLAKGSSNNQRRSLIGYWELEVATGNAYWSPEMWELYGVEYDPEAVVSIQNGMSVDHWIVINQKMKRLIEHGDVYHDIHEYRRPNQVMVSVESFAKRYIFEDGRIIVFGTAEYADPHQVKSLLKK